MGVVIVGELKAVSFLIALVINTPQAYQVGPNQEQDIHRQHLVPANSEDIARFCRRESALQIRESNQINDVRQNSHPVGPLMSDIDQGCFCRTMTSLSLEPL